MTPDEMFAREFKNTMFKRKARFGFPSVSAIPLPQSVIKTSNICKYQKILLKNIEEEYYSKLNNTQVLLLKRQSLSRRKISANGFILEKDGSISREDVDVPRNCVAVLSETVIGLPYSYKAKEQFIYVDYLTKGEKTFYIYIIPKNYCYKVNQTALVISGNKLRVFYEGVEFYSTYGSKYYMYIVPYRPETQKLDKQQLRIITTGSTIDYKTTINALFEFWTSMNYVFDYNLANLQDQVKGEKNVAYTSVRGIEEYTKIDFSKTLLDTNGDEMLDNALD